MNNSKPNTKNQAISLIQCRLHPEPPLWGSSLSKSTNVTTPPWHYFWCLKKNDMIAGHGLVRLPLVLTLVQMWAWFRDESQKNDMITGQGLAFPLWYWPWSKYGHNHCHQFNQYKQNEQSSLILPELNKPKKSPRHMTLEIKVLAWDRHNIVAELNRLMGPQSSPFDNCHFNGNSYISKR